MSTHIRRSAFILPGPVPWAAEKAMPSRKPDTLADGQAKRMMTAGGAPLPTRQIQQGPVFCPSCKENHRTEAQCGISKAVIHAGNKRGNPYHDSSTGRFSTAPSSGGSSGGGNSGWSGGGEGGGGGTTRENTVMGDVGGNARQAADTSLGSAKTVAGSAPKSSSMTTPNKPAAVSSQATNPGKVNAAKPAAPAEGGTLAGKVNAKPGAGPPAGGDSRLNWQGALEPAKKETLSGGLRFSHEGAQNAFRGEYNKLRSGGMGHEEAAKQAAPAGHRAYAEARRQLEPQPPAAATPPMRSAPGVLPTQTQQSGPPTGMNGPNTTQVSGLPTGPNGTQISGPPTGMSPSVTPSPAGLGQSPSPGANPQITPGSKNPAGGKQAKQAPGVLGATVAPWAHAGQSIGSGLFTPGGTAGTTGGAVGHSAHGLLTTPLNNKEQEQQGREQSKNAYQQQQQDKLNQNYTARLRRFLGGSQ